MATTAKWPFIVALVNRGSWGDDALRCGGSLISDRVVLTAAHCLEESSPEEIQVVAGKRSVGKPEERRIDVTEAFIDSRYDTSTLANDAAVLILAEPAYVPTVPTAQPAQYRLWRSGKAVEVAGWGYYEKRKSRVSVRLRSATLQMLPRGFCNLGDGPLVPSVQMCAGAKQKKRDSCQGDSGGPLITRALGTPLLIGLVSFGPSKCASPGYGGTYTKVAGVRDFVEWAKAWAAGDPDAQQNPLGTSVRTEEGESGQDPVLDVIVED